MAQTDIVTYRLNWPMGLLSENYCVDLNNHFFFRAKTPSKKIQIYISFYSRIFIAYSKLFFRMHCDIKLMLPDITSDSFYDEEIFHSDKKSRCQTSSGPLFGSTHKALDTLLCTVLHCTALHCTAL